jgi:hypothetical protein
MRSVVFGAIMAALLTAPAWADPKPVSGQTSVPFTNTLSCVENGYVVEQYARIWSVELSWDRDLYTVSFRMPDGASVTRQYRGVTIFIPDGTPPPLRTPLSYCAIEGWGKESVPVAERVAEQERQQAEEQARQQRIRDFEKSRRVRQ